MYYNVQQMCRSYITVKEGVIFTNFVRSQKIKVKNLETETKEFWYGDPNEGAQRCQM